MKIHKVEKIFLYLLCAYMFCGCRLLLEKDPVERHLDFNVPGKHHQKLGYFVGSWNTITKVWESGPYSDPVVFKGESVTRWILDKRFILKESKGIFMKKKWEGFGITGYDNFKKQYVGIWTDNMNTFIIPIYGNFEPEGNRFVFYTKFDDSAGNIHDRQVKYIVTIFNRNKHVVETTDLQFGARLNEVIYTRNLEPAL